MEKTDLRILIADDEEVIREACVRIIKRMGYQAVPAADGEEALRIVRDRTPDLVVLDIKMPVLDGMTLMNILAREKPGLPVVVITGHGTAETASQALKTGAVDFLTKPFSPDELRRTILRALSAQAAAS